MSVEQQCPFVLGQATESRFSANEDNLGLDPTQNRLQLSELKDSGGIDKILQGSQNSGLNPSNLVRELANGRSAGVASVEASTDSTTVTDYPLHTFSHLSSRDSLLHTSLALSVDSPQHCHIIESMTSQHPSTVTDNSPHTPSLVLSAENATNYDPSLLNLDPMSSPRSPLSSLMTLALVADGGNLEGTRFLTPSLALTDHCGPLDRACVAMEGNEGGLDSTVPSNLAGQGPGEPLNPPRPLLLTAMELPRLRRLQPDWQAMHR